MLIRDATPADAAGIAAIYSDAVENTTITWNVHPVDAEDRAAWIGAHARGGRPVLVALDTAPDEGATPPGDGSGTSGGHRVLGYAEYGRWRDFDGYLHSVEHSVYVRSDARGRGTGRALMGALIERARAQGVHVMVAAISGDNETSIRFHRDLGFRTCGVVEQAGTKFGRWLDLVLLQLILDEDPPPHEPRT